MHPRLHVVDLGRMAYGEALLRQRELVDARIAGDVPDTLLLVEHDPVFTLGRRRGARENVLDPGVAEVVEVERGGDVTWHGPGQLVAYPIVSLRDDAGERDLHRVLRRLEAAIIDVLETCGLEGERKDGYTGVWCQGRKVASLGIAVRGWVTFHGLALNVEPDLSWFGRINPCGLASDVMASIASLGGTVPAPSALRERMAVAVARHLERDLG